MFPSSWGTNSETYRHEEAKEICNLILQLQVILSLVLLALVDAEYRFLWVDARSSGSSSAAQIFNQSKLRKKLKNGTLGLLPPESLGERGQFHDNNVALMLLLMKLHATGSPEEGGLWRMYLKSWQADSDSYWAQ